MTLGLGLVWFFVSSVQAGPSTTIGESIFPGQGVLEGHLSVDTGDDGQIILELKTLGFNVEQGTASSGEPCQSLSFGEYVQSGRMGYTSLPTRGALVGIPVDGMPELEVLEVEAIEVEGEWEMNCASGRSRTAPGRIK
jgi:hypothetical protein